MFVFIYPTWRFRKIIEICCCNFLAIFMWGSKLQTTTRFGWLGWMCFSLNFDFQNRSRRVEAYSSEFSLGQPHYPTKVMISICEIQKLIEPRETSSFRFPVLGGPSLSDHLFKSFAYTLLIVWLRMGNSKVCRRPQKVNFKFRRVSNCKVRLLTWMRVYSRLDLVTDQRQRMWRREWTWVVK